MPTDDDSASDGSDDTTGVSAERISIVEEKAVVEKRDVERIGARIQLRTHEEEVPISETLRRERVEVERVAVDEVFDEPPTPREEEGALIVPVVEEVLVKRYRVVEELRVTSRAETVEAGETVTLRRQEAIVDDEPAAPTQRGEPDAE